jgi:HD-like signal output (HDOD) protein
MGESIAEVALYCIESGRARLPVFDQGVARAQQMLAEGRFEPEELEALVTNEPALASALLRAANSSLYGGLEKVVSIPGCLRRLGVRKCVQLVVAFGQRDAHRMRVPHLQGIAERLWRHSLACALGSDWLARRLRLPEVEPSALLAGLLHDVGKLFLLGVLDDLIVARPDELEANENLVMELLTALHVAQGVRLLDAWEIPEPYRRVVLRHHDGDVQENDALLLTVRLVDGVCNRMGIGLEPRPEHQPAASFEAQALRASEVVLAELEIAIEDALQIGG